MIGGVPALEPPDRVDVPLIRLLSETAIDAPLTALEHVAYLHQTVHDVRAFAISQARRHGHSWRAIATALDEAPATVARRYRFLDPPTEDS
jgi:hypothetical protein